jgi:hypothetical protein
VGVQRHAPAALPPWKTRYPLYRRLGGARGRSGRVRKISLPPGFDPRAVQPVASRYTDYPGPLIGPVRELKPCKLCGGGDVEKEQLPAIWDSKSSSYRNKQVPVYGHCSRHLLKTLLFISSLVQHRNVRTSFPASDVGWEGQQRTAALLMETAVVDSAAINQSLKRSFKPCFFKNPAYVNAGCVTLDCICVR